MSIKVRDLKVVALVAWYDEPLDLLWKCVRSLEDVADQLVAVDGAYRLFPNGKGRSPVSQHDEIRHAASEAKIPVEIIIPDGPWEGNEVEKRTQMFREGEKHCTEKDWFFVLDADEHVTAVGDFRVVLAATPFDVSAVDLDGTPYRQLYRALRDIYVDGAHYVYRHGERFLWGHTNYNVMEPCADTRMLKLTHTPDERPSNRLERRTGYYQARHTAQAEWIVTRNNRRLPG